MQRSAATVVVLTLFASVIFDGCGTDKRNDVAVVDGVRITAEQFRERYRKYLAGTSMKDNIQVRKQVLQNMINELLISGDLRATHASEDSAFLRQMDLIRRQAMVDGYARRLTTDTMMVTPHQLEIEFGRYLTRVTARYVYARTEDGARRLRERLRGGETFEHVARETFEDPGLANNGGSLGTFGWGEMEDPLEEAAYTLPQGELSEPLKLSMGYAIVRVDSRVSINPLASESDFAKVRGKLGDAIVKRMAPRLLHEHIMTLVRAMDPVFDEKTVEAVVAEWKSLAANDETLPRPESAPPQVNDLRGRNLVRLRGEWWTVETFMEKLSQTKERQRRRVQDADDLKDVVFGLAARDEILKQARALRLDEDPKVADQIENLGGEFRLRYWAGLVQDTVGRNGWPDTLLRRVYDSNKEGYVEPPTVNVAEILVRTEAEARRAAREVRGSADFAALARAKSIRLWAAKRGGELGFNSKAGYGVMGEKLFSARVGDLVGPDRVDPYWGVFKILDRKGGRARSFEESLDQTRAHVKAMKQEEAFRSALGALRARADVTINVENLGNIAVHSENN